MLWASCAGGACRSGRCGRCSPRSTPRCDWMADTGDRDGDGYVEYQRATPSGLVNQGWKDSHDGISFADGPWPAAPIALVEVQGYAYAALAWPAPRWPERTGDVAVAAAPRGAGRATCGAASTATSGCPDRERVRDRRSTATSGRSTPSPRTWATACGPASWTPSGRAAVARWLSGAELGSGWGVRTLATSMAPLRPAQLPQRLGVAPRHRHRRRRPPARRVPGRGHRLAADLLDGGHRAAAGACPSCSPASRPPTVAAGAVPDVVLAPGVGGGVAAAAAARVLGLEPDVPAGVVGLDPVLPAGATAIRLTGVPLAGGRVDIEVDGTASTVHGLPAGVELRRQRSPGIGSKLVACEPKTDG